MTTEYLKFKRLEDLHKAAAKTLRYCGFKAKARSDWKAGDFRVEIKNVSASEIPELKRVGRFSEEIRIEAAN